MKIIKVWKAFLAIMIVIMLITGTAGCGSSQDSDEGIKDPVENTVEDTDTSDDEILSELEDVCFCISSGTGGWMGYLTFEDDGSFTGTYIDTDYDDETQYDYSGKFTNVQKIGEYEYSMNLTELDIDGSSELPYLEKTEYSLFCPGTQVSSLPETASDWMLIEESGGKLNNYCLLYYDSSYGDVNPYYSVDISSVKNGLSGSDSSTADTSNSSGTSAGTSTTVSGELSASDDHSTNSSGTSAGTSTTTSGELSASGNHSSSSNSTPAGTSDSNNSSSASNSTSDSYSEGELCSMLEQYLTDQGFHVSSVEVESVSGDLVMMSAYSFGAGTYPRIGIFEFDRTTAAGYMCDPADYSHSGPMINLK